MVPDAELPPSQQEFPNFDRFEFEGDKIRSLNPDEYHSLRVAEICSWSSLEMR